MKKEKIVTGSTIEIIHVGKSFPAAGGSFEALKDIHVTIPEGKLTILKGRSGSGKTTLLNIIGALDEPTKGKVMIGGLETGALSEKAKDDLRRKKMGFVFQAVSLLPSLNAYQNVEFSLRLAGIRENRKKRVEECLRMVGLGNRMNHMPAEMSGGEQQRVAIARAIAHRPQILLADEPTAELDSGMAAEVARLLGELTRKEGVTIVMTTHDTGLMDAGDMIIELENGNQISVTEREEAPGTEEETAETKGKAPGTEEETAETEGKAPGTEEEMAETEGEAPGTGERRTPHA